MSAKRVDYRPISSLTELAAAAGAVSEAAFRAALLDRLGANDGVFTDVEDARLPTHAALLGTVLGRAMIGEPLTITSFSDAHILALRDRFASADVDAHIATALSTFEAHVRTLGALPGAPTSDEAVVRARAYATKVLAAVRDELQAVTERRPDGRFLSTLWVG
jgi:hypothetical protein